MRVKSKLTLSSIFLVLFAIIVGGGYMAAFPTIPQPDTQPEGSNTGTVLWDAELSHPYIGKDSDGEVLVNFRIRGQEIKTAKRAPVNLVLVIDRSGSMAEERKLEYAKEAARGIISGLGSGDRLGIVAYSTDVELLYPIQYLTDKEKVSSVVNSLYPTDATNLSGGLIMGIDQIKSLSRDGYINRVILLSDGLANEGITDIGELSRVASGVAEGGVHITAMGLGLNYDENLMTNLAEYGAGNYYFIESPNQLAGIFEKEFGQIIATVAKDTVMRLSPEQGVRVEEIYGYTHTVKDGKIQINLGEVFGGQERNILIKLNAPAEKLGKHGLVKASFEFTDILKSDESVKMQRELAYEVTEDKDKVAANENKDVVARGVSVEASNDLYRATAYYEKGEGEDALSSIKRALGSIVVVNKSLQRSEATIKQEAELRGVMEDMSEPPPLRNPTQERA